MSGIAIHANNAFANGVRGMQNASRSFNEATTAIAQTSLTAGFSGDTVSISGPSSDQDTISMEEGIIQMKTAGITYTASAKIVQAADEMTGTLLNTVV